jgi:hypothetical protein
VFWAAQLACVRSSLTDYVSLLLLNSILVEDPELEYSLVGSCVIQITFS